jgi:capsular polysaccharide biosynthesis protein
VIGGCGFGTGLVFVKDYLDPSFRTPDEAFAVLGIPVLASLSVGNGDERSLEAS